MTKITWMKTNRQADTLRLVELSAVAEMMKSQEFQKEVNELRVMCPALDLVRKDDGRVDGASNYTAPIPRICFASELVNANRQRVNKGYTGLVLLEVNNLQSYEEAAAIRQGAGLMPQTLMTFVGASGRSVKIVCRGEKLKGKKTDGVGLPQATDEVKVFHVALYEKARMAYNAQLGVTVEKLEPSLERTCYMSIDADVVYNPLAIPFYIDLTTVQKAVTASTIEPEETAPGLNRYMSLHQVFEFCLTKAYDEMDTGEDADSDDAETYTHLLAGRLADYCCDSGIPMSIALHLCNYRLPFREYPGLVKQVFENAYRKTNERDYRRRKHLNDLGKHVPQEALLAMKIDMFLRENYELRMNVMRGVAEYRRRTGLGFDFQDLTEQARNSMTMRALEQGIKCWDKDIRRYVNSDDIEQYDPMNDFLEHLPRWDGKERVEALARRVKTQYEAWPHLFHIWMRSMVAMWMGRGQLTGNALVPLLIGRQGCGKTSFCRVLLPRDQREYYNDRINFKNEQDLNLGLTSFALINLDEFDKITERQQIVLKYLVSTSDLKYRPPYGKAYTQHRRYASFIGTTNEPMPITDPTGSRRFVCVQVEGDVDFRTPIEYAQLYAQLKQEIRDGERYWLTPDEERALMAHNRQYQPVSGLGEQLLSIYRRPESDEAGQWIPISRISARLKHAFGSGYTDDAATLHKLGSLMSRPEYRFERRRRSHGIEYLVVER